MPAWATQQVTDPFDPYEAARRVLLRRMPVILEPDERQPAVPEAPTSQISALLPAPVAESSGSPLMMPIQAPKKAQKKAKKPLLDLTGMEVTPMDPTPMQPLPELAQDPEPESRYVCSACADTFHDLPMSTQTGSGSVVICSGCAADNVIKSVAPVAMQKGPIAWETVTPLESLPKPTTSIPETFSPAKKHALPMVSSASKSLKASKPKAFVLDLSGVVLEPLEKEDYTPGCFGEYEAEICEPGRACPTHFEACKKKVSGHLLR